MRLRKIHAIVAVSVALVLVARSVDARRRDLEAPSREPLDQVPHDPPVVLAAVTTEEPVAEVAKLVSEEPAAAESPDDEPAAAESPDDEPAAAESPDDEPAAAESPVTPVERASEPGASRRWVPRGPVAIAATVMVLMAMLAGAIAAAVGS
jgi:hypothetical protein